MDQPELNIDNLIWEITRRCNLSCAHCLRGTAQDKNITKSTMEQFFINNNIGYISIVTFTGGEPTLNIQAINDFIDICEQRNIEVGSFYIVINGSAVPDELIVTVARLYSFCSDNEMSQLQVSESDFYYDQDPGAIKRLEVFSIFSRKKTASNERLIREGNAIQWTDDYVGGEGRTIDINAENIELIEEDSELNEVRGDLYINVNGDIIGCCALSYESQEIHKLGNVRTDTITDILVKLHERYNQVV